MTKLTIIIPVFNVEKYIIKALESIKNQNVDINHIQVLIIDDGSTDNSAKLIKEWIEKNKKNNIFEYFYKENGNWGSVINYAKKNNLIKGQYVSILDADDYYDKKCFAEIFKIIDQDYDVIISNFYRINEMGKIKKTNVLYSSKSKEMAKKKCFTPWSLPLCKFFKTELFLQSKDLEDGISYQDQILFNYLILNSQKVFFIKNFLGYYFEFRPQSSTTLSWDEKRIKIWCNNMNKLLASNSQEIAAYVSMMINHCYIKANKNLKYKVQISHQYLPLIKKAKFTFLPKPLNKIAQTYFYLANNKIFKNSIKEDKKE